MSKISALYILLAGACWGMNGFFFRHLSVYGMGSMEVLFVKVIFSAWILGAFLLIKEAPFLRIRKKDLWVILAVGLCGMLIFNYLYFLSMTYSTVAVTVALVYTSPIFVVLISSKLFGEAITKRKVVALAVIFIGCASSGGVFSGGLDVTVIGLLIGIGAGLFYSSYSIFSRMALDRGYHGEIVAFYAILITAVGVCFMADFDVIVHAICPPMFLYSLGISFVCCLCPMVLYTVGLKKVETGTAAMLVTSEPVVAALSGFFLLGEPLPIYTAVGISLIVFGILLMNRKKTSKTA